MQKIKIYLCAVVFWGASLSAANVFADKIFLKSGMVVEGKVIEKNAVFIRINAVDGIKLREFLNEKVDYVEYGPIEVKKEPVKVPVEAPVERTIPPVAKPMEPEKIVPKAIQEVPVRDIQTIKEEIPVQVQAAEVTTKQVTDEPLNLTDKKGAMEPMLEDVAAKDEHIVSTAVNPEAVKEVLMEEEKVNPDEITNETIEKIFPGPVESVPVVKPKKLFSLALDFSNPVVMYSAAGGGVVVLLVILLLLRKGKKKTASKKEAVEEMEDIDLTQPSPATPVSEIPKPAPIPKMERPLTIPVLSKDPLNQDKPQQNPAVHGIPPSVEPAIQETAQENSPPKPFLNQPATASSQPPADGNPPQAKNPDQPEVISHEYGAIQKKKEKRRSEVNEDNFWDHVPGVFIYPLRGSILWATLGAAATFSMMGIAMMAPFVGPGIALMFFCYIIACMVNIIYTAVVTDEVNQFDWPSFLEWFDWMGKAILFVLANIISYGPAVFYVIKFQRVDAVLAALVAAGVFIGPMYTLSISLVGGIASLNVVNVFKAIAHVFWPYCAAIIVYGMISSLSFLANLIPVHLIPVAGYYVKWLIFVYFMFVSMRFLGIFYKAYRLRLGWFGEEN